MIGQGVFGLVFGLNLRLSGSFCFALAVLLFFCLDSYAICLACEGWSNTAFSCCRPLSKLYSLSVSSFFPAERCIPGHLSGHWRVWQ